MNEKYYTARALRDAFYEMKMPEYLRDSYLWLLNSIIKRAKPTDNDQYRKGFAEGYYARDREIVRCGDCKHRSKLTSKETYGVEIYVCNHDCGCAQCDDDDFCRYGERKDTACSI